MVRVNRALRLSAINRIYTRSGASKRGHRVPSVSTASRGLPRCSPAGIVGAKEKRIKGKVRYPVQLARFPWTNIRAAAERR